VDYQDPEIAQLYDDIVQSLVTAVWARELGRDQLADQNVVAALETARRLASGAVNELLHVEVAA
jgi:hypothetical protein